MPTLIDPADLIVGSWQNLRRNIGLYAEFAVWFVLLAVFEWFALNVLGSTVADQEFRAILYAAMTLPLSVVYMILIAAMTDATSRTIQGGDGNFRYALSHGAHRIVSYIGASILFLLAVVGGTAIFIIPGIFLLIALQFTFTYVIVEDMPAVRALLSSYRLVTGRWWAVAWRVFAPGVFFVLVSLFLTNLIELVAGAFLGDPGLFLSTISDTASFSSTYTLIAILIPRVVSGVTVPLWRASELLLWNDLKRTRPAKE